jgi:thymidylate synthase
MNEIKFGSLGETWIDLVETTLETGISINDETLELTGVQVAFSAETQADMVIRQLGDARMVAEMDKVFFAEGANALGHQYSGLMRGPEGRHDLRDVISLLRAEPASKRAVVTLCGQGNGKVPCINVVQFLVRSCAVQTIYFARGQDVFKKFYADALCLAKMARHVAEALSLPASGVEGFIGSSHVYHADRAAIENLLERAKDFLPNGKAKGAIG